MKTSRVNSPDTDADISVRAAIDQFKSFVIIAGAGSGKTTSLVKGLRYIKDSVGDKLLRQKQKVACITYTTVAETEIKNDVNDDPLFQVSTVHSFLWELIRPFQSDIKQWVKLRLDAKLNELIAKQSSYGPRVQQRTKDKDQAEIADLKILQTQIDSVNSFRYETGSSYAKGILGHSDMIKMVPQLLDEKPLLRQILVSRYPFVFVDESQDTLAAVVNSLILVDKELGDKFCLSFFGDPMQKIYTTGVGNIMIQPTWQEIVKPENFRSPTRVLDVINNIRKNGDGIEQKGGKRKIVDGEIEFIPGSASLYVFSNNEDKEKQISKVRQHLAKVHTDDIWLQDERDADVKILVIEHRMAAKRLKFERLFEIFKEHGSESAFTSFSEGTHYLMRPFLQLLIPAIKAHKNDEQAKLMDLLRKYCPLLEKASLRANKTKAAQILKDLSQAISSLKEMLADNSTATFGDVYKFCRNQSLYLLDERIGEFSDNPNSEIEDPLEEGELRSRELLTTLFACPAVEVLGYQKYIEDESVFSTQHSIKGAEFERVVVILDDVEGANSTLYSYNKLFGLTGLSKTDNENLEQGKDSVLDRTSRLLYVCCSRAKKDLAVVLFTEDPDTAYDALLGSNVFPKDSIFKDTDLELVVI